MSSTRKLPEDALTFRLLQEGDLNDVVELIKIENWFILVKSKLDFIYKEQLATFYVVVANAAGGQVLGFASVCKTREDEAMLGNVIIRKEHRGKGLGSYILRKVLELHSDTNLTWFSGADQFYMNLGCQLCEQQAIFIEMTVDRETLSKYCRENSLESDDKVVSFTENQKEQLSQYDAKGRGYKNPNFLSFVLKTSDSIALAMSAGGTDQTVRGYVANCREATGTLFFNGFYADNDKIAAHLMRAALDTFTDLEKVRFSTLVSRQFLVQFGTPNIAWTQSRFSTKYPPAQIPEEKLYCLSQIDLSY